jgi:hypothetical protein
MSEKQRIELLVNRDGLMEARAWGEWTLKIYREAIASSSHAATKEYRPLFEQSIRKFEDWLKEKRSP